jgi:predicted ABC-type ATPase
MNIIFYRSNLDFFKSSRPFLPVVSKAVKVALAILAVMGAYYYVRSLFGKKESEEVFETPFQAQAFVVIGCCGSGKSKWVDENLRNLTNSEPFVVIDADLVLTEMPKYQAGIKAGNAQIAEELHLESLEKRNKIFEQTIDKVNNLVFLGTGSDSPFYQQEVIGRLKKARYHVTVVCVKTNLELAIQRCRIRASKTSRVVPEDSIRNSHQKAYKNFEDYKKLAHAWELYDNNGQEFRLVEEQDGS